MGPMAHDRTGGGAKQEPGQQDVRRVAVELPGEQTQAAQHRKEREGLRPASAIQRRQPLIHMHGGLQGEEQHDHLQRPIRGFAHDTMPGLDEHEAADKGEGVHQLFGQGNDGKMRSQTGFIPMKRGKHDSAVLKRRPVTPAM